MCRVCCSRVDTLAPKAKYAGHTRNRASRWPLAGARTPRRHRTPLSHSCEPMPRQLLQATAPGPKFTAVPACCRHLDPLLSASGRRLAPSPLCLSLPLSAALCRSLPLSAALCLSLPLAATLCLSLSLSLRLCRSRLAHAVMGGAGTSQRASLERAWK